MSVARVAILVLPLLVAGCVTAGDAESDGDVVDALGPWRDGEADRFADVLEPLQAATGIDVQYVGSADFVQDLRQRVAEGANPPDIAVVPQLGLIEELIDDGELEPLEDGARRLVLESLGIDDATEDAAAGEGEELYAVPFRLTVKSLVWYRPEVFAEHGWEIPETLDELETLVDAIDEDDEMAPWCFSIQAGSATGWAATDWVEDLVLRTAGADVYERWVQGEVTFADDEIADAFTRFHDLVLARGRTAGGTRAIVETPVDEAWEPLLTDPPGCAMYKQADFATSWMPDDIEIGPDGDVDLFTLPGVDADETALVVGGDQIVQFAHSEDIDRVMAYLAESDAASIWAGEGGFISANPGVGDDVYPDRYRVSIDRAAERATEVVFDASDWMPPDVGSDLLWDQITLWVAGAVDYETFAETIDEAMAEALEGRD